jgi:hypothetical protein
MAEPARTVPRETRSGTRVGVAGLYKDPSAPPTPFLAHRPRSRARPTFRAAPITEVFSGGQGVLEPRHRVSGGEGLCGGHRVPHTGPGDCKGGGRPGGRGQGVREPRQRVSVAGGLAKAIKYHTQDLTIAAAKAAALRINLNVHGCSIIAAPIHAPSRTSLLLSLLLSQNLPLPRVSSD